MACFLYLNLFWFLLKRPFCTSEICQVLLCNWWLWKDTLKNANTEINISQQKITYLRRQWRKGWLNNGIMVYAAPNLLTEGLPWPLNSICWKYLQRFRLLKVENDQEEKKNCKGMKIGRLYIIKYNGSSHSLEWQANFAN